MARVIAIGTGGKAQSPIRDDRFREAIDAVVGRELLGRPIILGPCKNYEHADDVRRALFRSARHYCSCGRKSCTRRYKNYPENQCPSQGQRISCDADIVRMKDGKLGVQVTFIDKRDAMAHVISKYGPDPANWPYNPRAKLLKAGSNANM